MENSVTENLLEFKYNNKSLISELKTVHGTTINYEFESKDMQLMNVEKSFPIRENPSIGNTQNFVILATKTPSAIDIEIIDSSTMLVTQKFKLQAEVKSGSHIQVVMLKQHFLIIHETTSQRGISAFRFKADEGKFVEKSETLFFDGDAEFQYSSDFLVVRQEKVLKIMQLEATKWETIEFIFKNSIKIYTNRNFIAVHEGPKLNLIYKNKLNDKWMQKNIHSDFNGSTAALDKFDVTSDLKSKLTSLYQFQDGFQIHENIILWSETEESSGNFNKVLRVLMLDSKFNVYMDVKYQKEREYINDLSEQVTDSNGLKYTISYSKINDKYQVGIKDVCCSQKLDELFKTTDTVQREEAKSNLIKKINDNQSQSYNNFLSSFLFKSDDKYRVILAANEVHLGKSSIKFT